jgi:hypothetical protein
VSHSWDIPQQPPGLVWFFLTNNPIETSQYSGWCLQRDSLRDNRQNGKFEKENSYHHPVPPIYLLRLTSL